MKLRILLILIRLARATGHACDARADAWTDRATQLNLNNLCNDTEAK